MDLGLARIGMRHLSLGKQNDLDRRSPTLTDLPDSLLLKIFHQIPVDYSICILARTCERFRNLTEDFSLYKRANVRASLDIPQNVLCKLRFYSTNILQDLDFSQNTIIDDNKLWTILKHFRNVKHLNLSRCSNLTSHSLGYLVTYPRILQSLNLNDCRWLCPDMTLAVVTRHTLTLRHLDIIGCHHLTADIHRVRRMAEVCSGVLSLAIGLVPLPYDGQSPTSPIIDTDVRKFARYCRNLTSLRLVRCHIGDDSILALAATCPQIQSLDLSYTFISNDSLITIGKFFFILTELILKGCWKISDPGLVSLSEHRLPLRVLSLKKCTSITSACLAHFLTMLPSLRELDVGKCFLVSDLVIDSISEHCPKLGVLNIADTSVSKHKLRNLLNRKLYPMVIKTRKRQTGIKT